MEFIPYGRQTITDDDIESVVKVLRSPLITQGEWVPLFEKKISKRVDSQYTVCVNSATSALHIACKALGLRKGDWMWTSPITFVASANCGLYCDAKIDFVDIDKWTGLMNPEELENKLIEAEKVGKLPKIVIPVHLAGTSCNMKRIHELSIKYKFKIIEDASHAIGASYKGTKVGSCRYSDATVFSFHPVKIITTGEGGAVTTNCEKTAKKLKSLRSHGITKDHSEFEDKNAPCWAYEQQDVGFNYRLTDIQAALGCSQIERLESIIKERQSILKKYKIELADSGYWMLQCPKDCDPSVHLAVTRMKEVNRGKHRKIFEELRGQNIGVQLHYTPVHLQPAYRKMGFTPGTFKYSEEYATNAISIPVFPGLKEREQNYIITQLKKIY